MVLADLGRKLSSALADMNKSDVIDEKKLDEILKEICKALMEADVNVALVSKLRANVKKNVNLDENSRIKDHNIKRVIEKAVMDELCRLVDPGVGNEAFKPQKKQTKIIMMVGLQGAGKTTTCTKIAAYYQQKGFKTALVCADTFRAGAFDQLKQNATKAKIPFYGSDTEKDPASIAKEGVEKFKSEKHEIIIVDTSGRHKQEAELFEEMKQISKAVQPDSTIFVMDGAIGQAADGQARAFKEAADFGSIIITKMDGHAKGGGAISAVAATNSPIMFIGTGEHVHDIEKFEPKRFIRKMMGMGDMEGLMEKVQDMSQTMDKDTVKNLKAGIFLLRDFRNHLETASKMGPLSQIMGSIPGMAGIPAAMGDDASKKKLKRMTCILDSMAPKELDSDGNVFEQNSRIIRVAHGSGTTVYEVEELITQYRGFANMAKSWAPSAENGRNQNSHGSVDMQRALQQMSSNIPPGMMEQMGGINGIRTMMDQMGGIGGIQNTVKNMFGGAMPDRNSLMKMMGGAGGGSMPDMSEMMKMMGGGMGRGT